MLRSLLLSLALVAAPSLASAQSSVMAGLIAKAEAAVAQAAPSGPVTTACGGLQAALAKAKGGETLALPAGACNITSTIVANPASVVTITSADPTHPAVITYTGGAGSFLSNSSNMAFSQVEMSIIGNPDKIYGFRMYNDKNISFDRFDVHGDPAVAPGSQATAFYIVPASGISFTNGKFHDMSLGISGGSIAGLTMTGNEFYNLSKGGIAIGQVGPFSFTHNNCHDFHITPLVHADCMQLFTAGSTVQSHDITVTDNILNRGGGDGFQGIFIGDEADLGYLNVTVSRNLSSGNMWDTFYIDEPVGTLVVTDNYGASWIGNSPEGGAGSVTDYRSWLTIYKPLHGTLTSVTIRNNGVQAYTGTYFPVNVAPASNFLLGPVSPIPAS
jgi:hypothetical protein